jgi:Na+/melibiose symporter-like transporter
MRIGFAVDARYVRYGLRRFWILWRMGVGAPPSYLLAIHVLCSPSTAAGLWVWRAAYLRRGY